LSTKRERKQQTKDKQTHFSTMSNNAQNQNNRKLKEQPPVFRSATMAFHPSDVLNAIPYQQSATNEKTASFRYDTANPTSTNDNVTKKLSWSNPTLTTLGLYYPLGPSQRRFQRSQLAHLLETLVHVFYSLSLHTQYFDQPIMALCESLDQVRLEVQVWGARDHPEEIILEVSRHDGDCYNFHIYAHRILAAFPDQCPAPFIRTAWNLEPLERADGVLGLPKNREGEQQQQEQGVEEALDVAYSMLSSERFDARKLGFQSLLHMTDPCKSGWLAAKAVAQCILAPKGKLQEQLSETLVQFAILDTAPTTSAKNHYQSSFEDFMEEDDTNFAILADAENAYLSLAILSQTLRIAARDKTQQMMDTVKTFLNMWCLSGVDMVECMIEKVGNVHDQPHHGYYAVQCLAALYDCDRSLYSRIRCAHVEEAQMVGELSHFALAKVSEKLRVSLQA